MADGELFDTPVNLPAAEALRLGQALYDQKHYREALPFFDRAIDLDGASVVAFTLRGAARFALGAYADALTDIERVHALTQDARQLPDATVRAVILRLYADLLHRAQRYADAISALEELRQLQPLTTYTWALLGLCYWGLGERRQAVAAFHQELLQPDRMDMSGKNADSDWFRIARFLFRERAYADVVEATRLGLRIGPERWEGWSLQARALFVLKRPADALEASNHAVELNPADAWGWIAKAKSLHALKRYDEAREAYARARSLQTAGNGVWSDLVRIELFMLLRLRRWHDARAFLDAQVNVFAVARRKV